MSRIRFDYTKKLFEKGQIRRRLTRQLASLVAEVATEIAESVTPNTRVKVNGRTYETRELASSVGCWDVLGTYEDGSFVVLNHKEPHKRFFLHGDFSRPVLTASRKAYLDFANNLPEIVQAFEAEEDKIIYALQKGLEKLRQLAETELSDAC